MYNTITSIVVFLLVCCCLFISIKALIEIIAMIRAGQKIALFDQINKRIDSVITYVFLHKKVLDDKSYGFMHMFYLYGFLILGIGHLELVLYGLTKFLANFNISPFLYANFLPSFIVNIIDLSQDTMAFLVLTMVSIALFRRIVMPKKRLLPRSKDAETILWLIGLLYISFFMYIPASLAFKMPTSNFLWFYPISSLFAKIYLSSDMLLQFCYYAGFWLHISIFLGFMVYIPRSKHLHLIAAGPNIYFRHLDNIAKPNIIDFEKSEQFGAEKVTHLSWKSLLDTFACTECGRCDAVCPASLTKKPLHPKKVLHDLKLNLRYENWPTIKKYHTLFGDVKKGLEQDLENLEFSTSLISTDSNLTQIDDGSYDLHGQIHLDDIWSCTTCAACVDACPVLIDSVPTSLIEMRRNLVMMQANNYPKELNSSFRGMEVQNNPWGVGADKREDWAIGLDVPIMKDKKEAEYLFFVGCAGSTDDRAKKIQQALVRILKKASVDFAILGCEEKCTGDPARRMGNEYLFDTLAKENIEILNKYKFKKIFTSCPHCFNSLKNEYKDFGANYSVQHHSELINELLRDNRLSSDLKKEIQEKVTFHDPCYLGRYNSVYDAPREILKQAGNNIVEMDMNKRNSFCCGAGGGRMFMEEHLGKRINHERTDQAIKTNATTIATGCPFCMTMMSDGIKDKGMDKQIMVKDIAEIIAERI